MFTEYATAEAIFDYAEDRYGKRMDNESAVNEYVKTYMAGTAPADVKIQWMHDWDWKKVPNTPEGTRSIFTESWKGFKFEVKKK